MENKKSELRITRAISFLTLGFFLMNQVTFADPGAGIEVSLRGERPAHLNIDIPTELGTVDTLYEASSSKNPQFVLHIQDAHANYEAQIKIKQLLGYMDKKYGFKTIFVEGASQKLNAAYLRLFPDEESNRKLCDELAKQGELTGAELYLTEAGKKTEAFGIEEASLYKSNYEALQKVFGAADDVKNFFSGFDAQLDRVASKLLTPETRSLLADWKRFEQGRREFMPFVNGLVQQAQKVLNLDLKSSFAQISWPQTTRLLVIQQMEKELDKAKGIEEQTALVKMLGRKGVSTELLTALESFGEGSISLGKSRDEVSPRQLLERLATEAGPKGFRFSDYPHFSLYAGHVILRSELDPKALFGEIEGLFTRMLDTSAKESQQQTLLALYRDGELLRKLLHLELNRAQWRQVVEARDRIAVPSLLARLKDVAKTPDNKPSHLSPEFARTLNELFNAALEFYDLARQRENVFYQEMQTVMKERKITKAILITGGFHADGMSDLFRENAVSYGIVTPRLSEKSDEGLYQKSMLQNRPYPFEVSCLAKALSGTQSFDAQIRQGDSMAVSHFVETRTHAMMTKLNLGTTKIVDVLNEFFEGVPSAPRLEYASSNGRSEIRIVPRTSSVIQPDSGSATVSAPRSEARRATTSAEGMSRRTFLQRLSGFLLTAVTWGGVAEQVLAGIRVSPRRADNAQGEDIRLLEELEWRLLPLTFEPRFRFHNLYRSAIYNQDADIAATGHGLAALAAAVAFYEKKVTPETIEATRAIVLAAIQQCLRLQENANTSRFGFLYHYYVEEEGQLVPAEGAEVSTIDSAILVSGMLTAGGYFGGEVQEAANLFYERMNWKSFWDVRKNLFHVAWKNNEFLWHWGYYTDELLLINLLAAGAPNKSFGVEPEKTMGMGMGLDVSSYRANEPYAMTLYGASFSYYLARLYVHLDNLGPDKKMDVDWGQNSRNAIKAERYYALAEGYPHVLDSNGREIVLPDGDPVPMFGLSDCWVKLPDGTMEYRSKNGAALAYNWRDRTNKDKGVWSIAPHAIVNMIPFFDQDLANNPAFQLLKFILPKALRSEGVLVQSLDANRLDENGRPEVSSEWDVMMDNLSSLVTLINVLSRTDEGGIAQRLFMGNPSIQNALEKTFATQEPAVSRSEARTVKAAVAKEAQPGFKREGLGRFGKIILNLTMIAILGLESVGAGFLVPAAVHSMTVAQSSSSNIYSESHGYRVPIDNLGVQEVTVDKGSVTVLTDLTKSLPLSSARSSIPYKDYYGNPAVANISQDLFDGQIFFPDVLQNYRYSVKVDPTNYRHWGDIPAFYVIRHQDGTTSIVNAADDYNAGPTTEIGGPANGYPVEFSITVPADAVAVEGVGLTGAAGPEALTSRIWGVNHHADGTMSLVPTHYQRSESLTSPVTRKGDAIQIRLNNNKVYQAKLPFGSRSEVRSLIATGVKAPFPLPTVNKSAVVERPTGLFSWREFLKMAALWVVSISPSFPLLTVNPSEVAEPTRLSRRAFFKMAALGALAMSPLNAFASKSPSVPAREVTSDSSANPTTTLNGDVLEIRYPDGTVTKIPTSINDFKIADFFANYEGVLLALGQHVNGLPDQGSLWYLNKTDAFQIPLSSLPEEISIRSAQDIVFTKKGIEITGFGGVVYQIDYNTAQVSKIGGYPVALEGNNLLMSLPTGEVTTPVNTTSGWGVSNHVTGSGVYILNKQQEKSPTLSYVAFDNPGVVSDVNLPEGVLVNADSKIVFVGAGIADITGADGVTDRVNLNSGTIIPLWDFSGAVTVFPGNPTVAPFNGYGAPLPEIDRPSRNEFSVKYDVTDSGSYAGFVLAFGQAGVDLSDPEKFNTIGFEMKTDAFVDGPNVLVEVKGWMIDANGELTVKKAPFLVNRLKTEYGLVSLPAEVIREQLGDAMKHVHEIAFVFENTRLADKTGRFSIRTGGMGVYAPLLTGTAYDPGAITRLEGDRKEVSSGASAGSGIVVSLLSSRSLVFTYNLDEGGYAFVVIGNGYFNNEGQGPWAGEKFSLPSLTLALKSLVAGNQLKVEVVDMNGKKATFDADIIERMSNFSWNGSTEGIPGGFDYQNVVQINLVAEQAKMGSSGIVEVELEAFIPSLTPSLAVMGRNAPEKSREPVTSLRRSELRNNDARIAAAVAAARELKDEIPAVKEARLGFNLEGLRRLETILEGLKGTGVNARFLAIVLVTALAGGITASEISAEQVRALQTVAQAQETPLSVQVQKVRSILKVKDEEGLLIRFMAPGTAIGEANLVALANTKQRMVIVWMADAKDVETFQPQATKAKAELLDKHFAKDLAIQDRFTIAVVDQADPMAGLNRLVDQMKTRMPAISRGLQRYVFMGDHASLDRLDPDKVQALMIDQPVGKDELEEIAFSTLGARISQEILKVTEASEIKDAVARMLDQKGAKGIYSFKAEVLNAVLAVAMQALQAIGSAA